MAWIISAHFALMPSTGRERPSAATGDISLRAPNSWFNCWISVTCGWTFALKSYNRKQRKKLNHRLQEGKGDEWSTTKKKTKRCLSNIMPKPFVFEVTLTLTSEFILFDLHKMYFNLFLTSSFWCIKTMLPLTGIFFISDGFFQTRILYHVNTFNKTTTERSPILVCFYTNF